jgi:hypothetical protein
LAVHTIELLEEAVRLAEQHGIKLRRSWLGGISGGACQIQGESWIFVDLSLSSREQLDQVISGLRGLAGRPALPISSALRALIESRGVSDGS